MSIRSAAARTSLPWLAMLLAACAQTPVVIPPIPIQSAFTLPPAAPLGAIDGGKAGSALESRRVSLTQLLHPSIDRGEVGAPQAHSADLRLRWREAALFEPGTAQLRPQSLIALSHCARWLRADGRVVLQVVGFAPVGDIDALGERRSAAVAAFLIAEGALPERVRVSVQARTPANGDSVHGADSGIELIITPVILGREALAWVPPGDLHE